VAQRSFVNRCWYELLRRGLQLAGVLVFRARYEGLHNIPRHGPVLVVSNHQSNFDPPLVGMACSRRMNYLARSSLFRFGPFGWLIRSVDAIPIEREGIGLGGIKEAMKRLKAGEMVVIFPEGTRTRDGQIAPFRPGFATLAVRTRAAILPAAIEGAFDAWPRSQVLPRRGNVRVRYGEPILPEQFTGRSEEELVAEVEARVRACHAQLQRSASRTPRK
jgi:1-acyl-sn-glycerol-3-phosphate acyltransferase